MNTEPLFAYGANRRPTFNAALAHLESAPAEQITAELTAWGSTLHAEFVTNPAKLAAALREITPEHASGQRFGHWKAAQQVLAAAGLPEPAPGA